MRYQNTKPANEPTFRPCSGGRHTQHSPPSSHPATDTTAFRDSARLIMIAIAAQSPQSQAGKRPAAGHSSWRPSRQQRQLAVVAARQRRAAALQRSNSNSDGSGGSSSGSGAQPLSAALLAAVQTFAALQLAVAAPAYANGGDFKISSQAPGPEAAAEEQYFETVSPARSLASRRLQGETLKTLMRLGLFFADQTPTSLRSCLRGMSPWVTWRAARAGLACPCWRSCNLARALPSHHHPTIPSHLASTPTATSNPAVRAGAPGALLRRQQHRAAPGLAAGGPQGQADPAVHPQVRAHLHPWRAGLSRPGPHVCAVSGGLGVGVERGALRAC